jgi:hypothetical protein
VPIDDVAGSRHPVGVLQTKRRVGVFPPSSLLTIRNTVKN